MEEIIEHCQRMTVNKTEYFICMEAVKTEAAQTRYQLLQPYMDHTSIVDHAQLWKQMVVFFVHTQGKENKKPKYQLNKKKECIWRDDESNMDSTSKTKIETKMRNQN